MKRMTNALASIAFILTLFSCKDTGEALFSGEAKNMHSAERTTTVTDISGVVPAGVYDVLRPTSTATITLSSGVVFNSFDWSAVSTADLYIPSGATVRTYGIAALKSGVKFRNGGTFYNHDYRFEVNGAEFINSGQHYPQVELNLSGASVYKHSVFGTITGGLLNMAGSSDFKFNSTGFLGTATFNKIKTTMSGPAISGTGRLYTNGGDVLFGPLTAASTVKICTTIPFEFYLGATFGPGSYSCP